MKQFDVFVLQICAGIETLAFLGPCCIDMQKTRHFYLLPVSHLAPSYPSAQLHSNLFSRLLHVAPFWHGDDAHSLMSVRKVRESTTCTAISCIYFETNVRSCIRKRYKAFLTTKIYALRSFSIYDQLLLFFSLKTIFVSPFCKDTPKKQYI